MHDVHSLAIHQNNSEMVYWEQIICKLVLDILDLKFNFQLYEHFSHELGIQMQSL